MKAARLFTRGKCTIYRRPIVPPECDTYRDSRRQALADRPVLTERSTHMAYRIFGLSLVSLRLAELNSGLADGQYSSQDVQICVGRRFGARILDQPFPGSYP